jgi:hypothetical protein
MQGMTVNTEARAVLLLQDYMSQAKSNFQISVLLQKVLIRLPDPEVQ